MKPYKNFKKDQIKRKRKKQDIKNLKKSFKELIKIYDKYYYLFKAKLGVE